MEPVPVNFGTQTDTGRYGADGGPEHLNCFIQPVKEGKHPFPIYAAGGHTLLTSITDGTACRGLVQFDSSTAYGLFGSLVAKITYDGTTTTTTAIGGIPTTQRAVFAVNQKASSPQVAIITDGQRYYIENDVLAPITDADLPSPVSVTFLNQRVLYGIEDGRTFYSDVDDVTSIGAGSVFTAEGNSDKLVRGIEHIQEYWVFGERSIEIWRDTGASTAPYRRNTGAVIPKGCVSRDSIATLDREIFWLADDLTVYKAQGYTPIPLYHQSLEVDIKNTTDKTDIRAFTYYSKGNAFYVLKSSTWTWVYNKTTGKWFKRESQSLDFWRCEHSVRLQNRTLFGDYENSNIYLQDEDVFAENGNDLVMRIRSAPQHQYPHRMIIDRLYLDFITGVGLNSSNSWESDPQVGLRFSDDLGLTWSNQRFQPLGKMSERNRVVFEELGETGEAGRMWEIEVSSPVVRALSYAAVLGEKLQA